MGANVLARVRAMIKNTAGQKIGAQMVSATDGSAFTGAVTVNVTGDAGTQATGSVGSGACVHEGNGLHTYAPAQAETNYDHIAFTFVGTGAVPASVQVFPVAGDPFTRLGAPAGASVSADVAAMKLQTAAIETDTQDIQSRLPAALIGGRIDATVDATGMEAGAIDAILDETIGDGTTTFRQALRVLVAGMAGKLSGAATTTITIRNMADTADVIVATVDADGNRSATTVTP